MTQTTKKQDSGLTLAAVRERNRRWVKDYRFITISPLRTMAILSLGRTFYVETSIIDDEGVETIELWYLPAFKSPVATLIARRRYGDSHSEMRSYPRDTTFPLFKKVRVTCQS